MAIRREFGLGLWKTLNPKPEQNGVAERKNWSVVKETWAMLEEKSLPKFYSAEAVRTAVYI